MRVMEVQQGNNLLSILSDRNPNQTDLNTKMFVDACNLTFCGLLASCTAGSRRSSGIPSFYIAPAFMYWLCSQTDIPHCGVRISFRSCEACISASQEPQWKYLTLTLFQQNLQNWVSLSSNHLAWVTCPSMNQCLLQQVFKILTVPQTQAQIRHIFEETKYSTYRYRYIDIFFLTKLLIFFLR